MFAAAILKYIERKETEAKNFLKLVSKLSYESEYGEEIEKAWLLLAESFIKVGLWLFRSRSMTTRRRS